MAEIDDVFQRQRHAVQWSSIAPAPELGIRLSCLRQRLISQDGDVCVECRVSFRDTFQAVRGGGLRGQLARTNRA
jgi:hypothetical protein